MSATPRISRSRSDRERMVSRQRAQPLAVYGGVRFKL
jgi:hypothetical protein